MNEKLATEKKIFVYIETEVQFDSIAPLLAHLRDKRKAPFDIVVPADEGGVNEEIFDEAAKLIRKHGFSVNRQVTETLKSSEYQILLSPYIYHWQYYEIKAKYFIQYTYGSYYFNKPNWNINRLLTEEYLADAVLSHAAGTQAAVDVVSKSYITPELRLSNFSRRIKDPSEKPTILFVPTYNDMDFATRLLEVIDELKEEYHILLRGHHRVVHVDENKGKVAKLYDKADKVYDISEHTIKTPLEEADIVVSDNSSAFLEAISVGIPVALFSRDPNVFKYREINSVQYNLVQRGDILWTDDPQELPSIINKTLSKSMIEKQRKMSLGLFPDRFPDPIGRYMEVLDIYLNDKLPPEYRLVKKYWIERIDGLVSDNDAMQSRVQELESELAARYIEMRSYLGIKRSVRLLVGNIKRKILKR